ncbi:alpha/beta fold hydrolase [Amycolatopsis orientalis]|uniref:alpha/beta fold hydrolase n=1 Tax=Amycolatopsis orientalis TaxID=31958 RepID=UPI00039F0C36|nr:alpha/beta fold hydrolase [Amycolatopsis orientalis]
MTAEQPGATEYLVGSWPGQLRVTRYPREDAPRVVFLHGGSHTRACWSSTPDRRAGWAPQFAASGYDVHIVDYIDIGRSYPVLERTAEEVLDGLAALLRRIGPAALVGHSLGGGLAIKATERVPDLVEAAVLLAPASVEVRNPGVLPARAGEAAILPREVAVEYLANAPKFPKADLEAWLATLVSYSPHLRNAGSGATPELKVDPDRAAVWRTVPALLLLAEEDRTVAPATAARTAQAMGVPPTLLGADWNLPGHGHMFIVERDSEAIADRVLGWLAGARQARR